MVETVETLNMPTLSEWIITNSFATSMLDHWIVMINHLRSNGDNKTRVVKDFVNVSTNDGSLISPDDPAVKPFLNCIVFNVTHTIITGMIPTLCVNIVSDKQTLLSRLKTKIESASK